MVKKLGRYEIIREIGKGAMGIVYLAHDPKIDRKIAIKTISISAGMPADEARETRHRFVREAQAAGKLQHPNIITIYDVVEEENLSYIAMEYIDGETLESYVRPGSVLPLPKILSITAQACSALDYAHKHNVIHRDIKPANLMLVKGELLKITDFGLAKHPEANLTQDGVLIGTPNYMSPEQISGKPMDGRSDFFSLGVVLYELLTGERPFGGDTISTIIYRILYEEPRPPRVLNGKLPVAFDALFKRALAKEPAERFQTGGEFVDALNNYSTRYLKAPVSPAPVTLRASRIEVAPRPEERGRSQGRVRTTPPPDRPLLAGQPVKIAALAFFIILALLLFPHRIHEAAKGEKLIASELAPPVAAEQAGFTAPLTAPKGLPGGLSSGIRVAIRTDRPAAKLYWDKHEIYGSAIDWPDSDAGEHTLQAVDGCREDSQLVRRSTIGKEIRLSLKPRVGELPIGSKPQGADVFLNDKKIGTTPMTYPGFQACEPVTFVLRKENFSEFRRTSDGTQTWNEISEALKSVTLSEIPPGHLKFTTAPSGYRFEVFEGDRSVPLEGGRLTLRQGTHSLTIRSPEVFFTLHLKVEITGEKTVEQKIDWPGVGKLTVLAEPSNCEVFVDGAKLDDAPILEAKIVAGRHTIRVVPRSDPRMASERLVEIEVAGHSVEKFTF